MENKNVNLSKKQKIDYDEIIIPIKNYINATCTCVLIVILVFMFIGFYSLKNQISYNNNEVAVIETNCTVMATDTVETTDTAIVNNDTSNNASIEDIFVDDLSKCLMILDALIITGLFLIFIKARTQRMI